MSMDLMVKAMNVTVGNPLRKLVLIKLADNANDKGECWPSYQHIADQCEISRRSVMNHVDALVDSGFLRKVTRKGPKGNASNVYILTISGGEYVAPPSAGDSPGVVQEIHQPSESGSPHSAGDSPGGSAGDSPRTSHSFEPVIEPVTEPIGRGGSGKPTTPPKSALPEPVIPKVELPADMPGPKDPTCKTFKAWANYAMAYRKRYGTWPMWNAKAAGQIGQLVKRLGIDVAHSVAAYYLTINDARMIQDFHSLGILIAKAEAIHTQWVTGRQMNGRTARQLEDTQANRNAAQTAAEQIREKGAKTNAFL